MQYQYWRLLLKDLKACKTLMENDNCTQRLFLGGKKDSLLGSRELYTLITKFPHLFSTVKTVDIWILLSLGFFMDLVQVYDWIFAQTIVCTNGVGSEWINDWMNEEFLDLFVCLIVCVHFIFQQTAIWLTARKAHCWWKISSKLM